MNEKRTTLSDVARILQLIANQPNSRPDPSKPYITVFDGGSVEVVPGSIRYQFSDGTTAWEAVMPHLFLGINFPDGVFVKISHPDN